MNAHDKKLANLKKIIKRLENVVLAYSGGVDSTFLLKTAIDVLGKEAVLAVTAKSKTFPDQEVENAKKIAKRLNAAHVIIKTYEVKNEKFAKNPVNRCYYCKKELFSKLKKIARENGLKHVIDGSNSDDLADLRFGSKAARELGINSPLIEAGFRKSDIREESKRLGLPTWNRGSFACLASRIQYNQRITKNELRKIGNAEEFLKDLGFKQVRVRLHKNLARIEVEPQDISRFLRSDIRGKVLQKLSDLGFIYVTLDLKGFRSGSMNEALLRR